MLEELEKAEKYIFIEFFILAEGYMWEEIHRILKKKAESGVEVKIIFDDFGSIKRQRKGFITKLRSEGIKVSIFNPITPSMNIFMNNRNHRKIVIIDGKTAILDGLCCYNKGRRSKKLSCNVLLYVGIHYKKTH